MRYLRRQRESIEAVLDEKSSDASAICSGCARVQSMKEHPDEGVKSNLSIVKYGRARGRYGGLALVYLEAERPRSIGPPPDARRQDDAARSISDERGGGDLAVAGLQRELAGAWTGTAGKRLRRRSGGEGSRGDQQLRADEKTARARGRR